MKKCPYCAEEIQDDAIICWHCGRDISISPESAGSAPVYTPPVTNSRLAEGQKLASNALTSAIIGIFCFGVILGPVAISRAKNAKKILSPGDPGYGNAQAAEIIGWIVLALYLSGICLSAIGYLTQYNSY